MKERKRISKFLIIAGLIILNNFGFSFCEENSTPKNAKIIIIGSGPSGIAAAAKLMENGFNNVTILEAEDRIGGRVFTMKLDDYSVDMGGQWVHGEVDNVAFEMANPLGLLEVSHRSDYGLATNFINSLGDSLNPEDTNKIFKFIDEHLNGVNVEKNPGFESVGQYVDKAFDEVFKDNPAILNDKKKYILFFELLSLQSDAAESWNDVSALGTSKYKVCAGDQAANWKERGYSTILDLLMKRYPDPEKEIPVMNNTILSTEVTSIDYSNNTEGAPIVITTANGQIYKADHVIVTVSLGVLKDRHKSLFNPSLPDYKVNAIEGLGFGTVAKIYMLFEKPFWTMGDERVLHLFFLWNSEDIEKIEADSEKKWLLGLSEAMTVEHKPNLLLMWVTGKHVKLMEELPAEKIFNHTLENLQRFLGKTHNVTTPVAMLASRWYSNPFFKGTYSYRSLESDKRHVFPEMLERPLDEQTLRVLFAGEATETNRYSTVDGAILSGWTAANRLINHYKKEESSKGA